MHERRAAHGRRPGLLLSIAMTAALVGCARATTPPVRVETPAPVAVRLERPLRVLAVLPPIVEARASESPEVARAELAAVVAEAARGGSEGWRVVEIDPPPAVTGETPVAMAGRAAERAQAGAALLTIVRRYRERIGTAWGAERGASVEWRLLLVPAGGTEAVWIASYGETQQPTTYNLFDAWQVLRGGPRWLEAADLARIGVEEAMKDLGSFVAPRRSR